MANPPAKTTGRPPPDLNRLAPSAENPARLLHDLRQLLRKSRLKTLRVGRGISRTGQAPYYEVDQRKVIELLGGLP